MKFHGLPAVAAVMSLALSPAWAQAPEGPPAPASGASAAPAPAPVAPPPASPVKLPEGTEFPLIINDKISSQTAAEGDRFTISLAEDVTLSDGTVLKAGYRGVGEVATAQKNGMLGKSGKLNLRLNYLKVGDQRIRLRGSKSSEGKGNTTNQVVGVVFLGVFAAFIKGHSVEVPRGTAVKAYADEDIVLKAPLAPPPARDDDL